MNHFCWTTQCTRTCNNNQLRKECCTRKTLRMATIDILQLWTYNHNPFTITVRILFYEKRTRKTQQAFYSFVSRWTINPTKTCLSKKSKSYYKTTSANHWRKLRALLWTLCLSLQVSGIYTKWPNTINKRNFCRHNVAKWKASSTYLRRLNLFIDTNINHRQNNRKPLNTLHQLLGSLHCIPRNILMG